MRVIEADAVVKAIDKHTNSTLQLDEDITCILEEIPTIEERKTGQWIKMSDADGIYYACSECGEDLPRHIERTHYCPYCGADMRNAVEIARDTNLPILPRASLPEGLAPWIVSTVETDIRINQTNIARFKEQF